MAHIRKMKMKKKKKTKEKGKKKTGILWWLRS